MAYLVGGAGTALSLSEMGASTSISAAGWQQAVDVNLTGSFFAAKHQIPAMLARGRGSLIFTSTFVGHLVGFPGAAAYAASKHAVAGVTQALSNEWAGLGINVNAIAPGYIESNNTTALRADPGRSAAILSRIPAGRWGVADDIGDAAVFLLAPASNYMHGAVLPVDGGWLAR